MSSLITSASAVVTRDQCHLNQIKCQLQHTPGDGSLPETIYSNIFLLETWELYKKRPSVLNICCTIQSVRLCIRQTTLYDMSHSSENTMACSLSGMTRSVPRALDTRSLPALERGMIVGVKLWLTSLKEN